MSTAGTLENIGALPVEGQLLPKAQAHNLAAKRLLDIHTLQDELTSSPYSHDIIELAMAAATSLRISTIDNTALVWLLIVGHPGSDKTQTVLLLKQTLNAFYLDSLTENSLMSAYIDPKTNKPAESLLPQLNGKCFIVKDLTTLLSEQEDKVKKILGDLQSIYDGEYKKATGTLGVLESESVFSMLGCVTPAAIVRHHNYMSRIGGRFLFYRVFALTDEEREEAFALHWEGQDRKSKTQELQYLVNEHVRHLLTSSVELQPEGIEQRKWVQGIAVLLARGRGIISYELEEPQIEEPFRAMLQVRNLGRALARVHGRASMTDHEMALLHSDH
jgi:hypothetical protein